MAILVALHSHVRVLTILGRLGLFGRPIIEEPSTSQAPAKLRQGPVTVITVRSSNWSRRLLGMHVSITSETIPGKLQGISNSRKVLISAGAACPTSAALEDLPVVLWCGARSHKCTSPDLQKTHVELLDDGPCKIESPGQTDHELRRLGLSSGQQWAKIEQPPSTVTHSTTVHPRFQHSSGLQPCIPKAVAVSDHEMLLSETTSD